MDKNPPANAGDMDSIPGPEGFHMLLRNGVFPAIISKQGCPSHQRFCPSKVNFWATRAPRKNSTYNLAALRLQSLPMVSLEELRILTPDSWDALEKAMAPHSSTLAWKTPWTEEPGRLQSIGSLRVGHDWATSLSLFTLMHWRRKWQPTPVFLPGESQERGSLMGCRLWGHTESDTTEAT